MIFSVAAVYHDYYIILYIMLNWMVALQNKYRQAYDMSRGQPPAIITDTPEMIRIRKAQEQLSEVKTVMMLSSNLCYLKFNDDGCKVTVMEAVWFKYLCKIIPEQFL